MADKEYITHEDLERKDIKDNFVSDKNILDAIITPGSRTPAEQRQDDRDMARILRRILKNHHKRIKQ